MATPKSEHLLDHFYHHKKKTNQGMFFRRTVFISVFQLKFLENLKRIILHANGVVIRPWGTTCHENSFSASQH